MSEIISCTHKVTLDIAKRDVHMIQVIYGDTANILEVNLCENGKEISLENATLATITYSNNTFDEMQISEDYRTASVRINANCLKQGLNFAQISIYSGDNGLITADMLTIDCNQKIGGENPSCPNADMPKLKELINQLIQQGIAEGISPEQIADAVANYLAKNPIEETDPNVHEWAKAKEKPTYTAEEVGALSYETLKPAVDLALARAKASGEFDGADGKSAYQYAQDGGYTGTEAEFAEKLAQEKFASPNALTFTGAVTGSYDGSEALTVEIPAGGGGTGGGNDAFELIGEATSSGVSDVVGLTIPLDGSLYRTIIAYAYNLPAGNKKRIIIRQMKAWYNGFPLGWNTLSGVEITKTWGFFGAAMDVDGKLFTFGAAEARTNSGHGYFRFYPQDGALPALSLSDFKFISLDCNSNSEILPDGCSLVVWGVRK